MGRHQIQIQTQTREGLHNGAARSRRLTTESASSRLLLCRLPVYDLSVSTAKKRILVADDEPNLRRVIAAVFSREGYEVLTAQDGVEALQLLQREEVQA